MTPIREMLLKRRGEVKALLDPLLVEMREIDLALGAMGSLVHVGTGAKAADPKADLPQRTVEDKVFYLVANSPNGLTTREVHTLMREKYKRDMKLESVGWYLSKIKRDNEALYLDGTHWKAK